MSGLTPDDVAYLTQRSAQYGYDPQHLLRAMNYESSGDPTRWGGKGGNYFGLIQFGPEERKQFGVDTKNPNARNQIDATLSFLQARGYKPGMGLLDMYSTINAGSPGHYNAFDGNGTVASHVAKMLGQPTVLIPPTTSATFSAPMFAPKPQALPDISPQGDNTALNEALQGLLSEQPQQTTRYGDDFIKQIQDLHAQAIANATQGLI